jgi:HD superfamily phosphohydrolase
VTKGINKRKIINDPVHGFISVPGDFIYDLIQNPFFQRLRYIRQLGLTDNVFPGASHTRFLHSLGALHLIGQAVSTLKSKGVDITVREEEALQAAILLHDIGHGPFSHALESLITEGVNHEELSLFVMNILNRNLKGRLSLAIEMFRGTYDRHFFHDLISSQIDMDRLDYLLRDSFYTGVIEGSVGADRIIKMLNVSDNRLVVDEKGIYSVEKFLIARRLMYWQVYMHKTVVSAEKLLVAIVRRARELVSSGVALQSAGPVSFFLENRISREMLEAGNSAGNSVADNFLSLDDNEMMSSVRMWSRSKDTVLSLLSSRLLKRELFAIELRRSPFEDEVISNLAGRAEKLFKLNPGEGNNLVFSGAVSNMTYAPSAPRVRIMDKKGLINEITEVSDILDHKALSREITKYFLCYPKELRGPVLMGSV